MSTALLLALTCCAITDAQQNDFHASIEATPTELRLGDVVFARIWLTYKGKELTAMPGKQFSRLIGNLSLKLIDQEHDTTITLPPDVSGSGMPGSAEMKPGETWLVGYELLKIPPMKSAAYPSWDPRKLSTEPYLLRGHLTIGRRVVVDATGPSLTIRTRPETELAELIELHRGRPNAWRNIPADFDSHRSNMNWCGFTFAPPEYSTSEHLAALEKVLSPGSSRDIVHLTRLTQAVYDEKDPQQRRKNLADLCAWLESLPEIERNWMAMQVITWAAGNKGLGFFGFEVATEAALRLQAGDRDPYVRRFHESRGRKRIAEQPSATPAHHETTVGQLDSLQVAMEAAPTDLHMGDVVFVKLFLTNMGKEPMSVPGYFSRGFGNLDLRLMDSRRDTRFTLRPGGGGFGGSVPRKLQPGERWFVGYEIVNVPSLEHAGDPFWNPETLSEKGYVLCASLKITPRVHVEAQGPTLTIRPRPKAEMAKLLELCRPEPDAWRDMPSNWDSWRPSLNWSIAFAPPRASTAENLATLETTLSPGTLCDFIRLTRRAQAVYDGADAEEQRQKLDELLNWLETLSEVERIIMMSQFTGWAQGNKGLGVFGYRIAVEAALRPSLWDQDIEIRKTWLRNYLKGPLAAPYLRDFEERLEIIEKQIDERSSKGKTR